MAVPLGGSIVSEIILIILAFAVVFVIFKIGKFLFKIVAGLIINSVLGLISIFALNTFLGLGITMTFWLWVAVAIFGLPAVIVIVILHLMGIVA
ncbi:MAG: transcriptional regulator [Candidatus Marsarchaeota archaeon]|nr:transcriptional regulator [Candidatus Marsarchaeota archaeon]